MKKIVLLLSLVATVYTGIAAAKEFKLPFGLVAAPDAKLLDGYVMPSAAGDREESISIFATKSSLADVIAFYRESLETAGFQTYSASDRDGYVSVAAKRDRDRISISVKTEGYVAEPGNNEIKITATYDK